MLIELYDSVLTIKHTASVQTRDLQHYFIEEKRLIKPQISMMIYGQLIVAESGEKFYSVIQTFLTYSFSSKQFLTNDS